MGKKIGGTPRLRRSWKRAACAAMLGLALAGCGGGNEGSEPSASADEAVAMAEDAQAARLKGGSLSVLGAYRLADQATFGASEKLLTELGKGTAEQWINSQFVVAASRYASGGTNAIHTYTGSDFCADNGTANCWNFYYSSQPLAWDFYRNAVSGNDQLRQRVALALSQINVVSQLEVEGTYGLRNWHNNFITNAFGNYRTVLKKVALSPVMGDYLNNVNNNKTAPNENFARELLQLFAIGTCELEQDGSLKGGKCQATYDNARVREYAFALTGWTYPPGGKSAWCAPRNGINCRFYDGDMVARPAAHDSATRKLLGTVSVPAGSTAEAALESVLDSLMAHPNMAPFIGRQLIQHLVTSNPSAGYVARVSYAFNTGRYGRIGTGVKGDLRATVTAILLDQEARGDSPPAQAGRLREPVQFFAGVLRALNGTTDGEPLTWWWGEALGQHVFRPPSVFNYYRPDYPVAGTQLQGPQFGILNANTGLARINYVNYLVNWGGSAASTNVPNALPTQVNLDPFLLDASDPAKLVDRMVRVGLGGRITPAARQTIINAVAAWTASNSSSYLKERVKTAAYLVFASPQYQIAR